MDIIRCKTVEIDMSEKLWNGEQLSSEWGNEQSKWSAGCNSNSEKNEQINANDTTNRVYKDNNKNVVPVAYCLLLPVYRLHWNGQNK